jgi:hypothetical protein
MTSLLVRTVRLVTAVSVALLAIPVLGALIWGTWRLLFWAVVDAAPSVRHAHPSGMPVPSAMPPGTDAIVVAGEIPFLGIGLTPTGIVLLTLVTLGVIVLAVVSLAFARDPSGETLAPSNHASTRGDVDDELARRPVNGSGDLRDRPV